MDFYAILGIPVDADQKTIRNAYRILARRYHPDTGAGSSIEQFRQVAEAYETLIDPGRRQGYDLSLLRSRPPAVVPARPFPARAERLHQENPNVFGRFERKPGSTVSRSSFEFDELFYDWIRSLDNDLFFGTLWRW